MKGAGLMIIVVGVIDVLLAFFVIGPRAQDEKRRRLLVAATAGTGALFIALGTAVLLGLVGRFRG